MELCELFFDKTDPLYNNSLHYVVLNTHCARTFLTNDVAMFDCI